MEGAHTLCANGRVTLVKQMATGQKGDRSVGRPTLFHADAVCGKPVTSVETVTAKAGPRRALRGRCARQVGSDGALSLLVADAAGAAVQSVAVPPAQAA